MGVAGIVVIKRACRQEAPAVVPACIVPQIGSAAETCIVRCPGVSAAQMGHIVIKVSELYLD